MLQLMRFRRLVLSLCAGIAAVAALLWLLDGSGAMVTAGPVQAVPAVSQPKPEDGLPPSRLSDATPIHFVATSGTDSGDCSPPAGACRTIQYAVDEAGEGDEVRVASGTYTDVHARPRDDVSKLVRF